MNCKDCMWWAPNRQIEMIKGKICLESLKTTNDLDSCQHFSPASATENNVPQHTPNGIQMIKQPQTIDGPVHILIVTHAKDLPWLRYAMMLIEHHLTGFSGVTVAVPEHELHQFIGLGKASVVPYPEVRGKGMLQHMAKMAEADELVPAGTAFVMHMDADCMFHTSSTPEDFFTDGKPDYLFRPYHSLISVDPLNPGSKVISDCYQWKTHTEQQLGFRCPDYTMTRHPTVFPIEFYKHYRDFLSFVHRQPYTDFFLSGRNEHPQDRMDFTAMGAWAKRYIGDRFNWIDVSAGSYPADRLKAYWSHGGITPEIRHEIEGFLK